MASFFGVLQPPPDLPGGLNDLISDATSKFLSQPDWGAFMTIADKVKALNVEQMRDVVTVIKLRVGSSSHQTQLLSIHLAESLSKNCGMAFLRCLGDKEFMAQLKKVAEDTRKSRDRLAQAVNKQLLDLIQIWGEEFLTMQERFGLHEFVALYHELRAKGHAFSLPQLDESRPPIFTPPAAHAPAANASAPAETVSSSSGASPSSQAPLQFPLVRQATHLSGQAMVLRNSANMVAEMLQAAHTAADVKANDVLREMLQELAASVPQLQNSLEASLERPQLAEELFNLNDDILIAAQLYKYMRKHGAPAPVSSQQPQAEERGHTAARAATADEDLLGAFTSNSHTATDSEQTSLSPASRRHGSVSHVRGGALEATGRGVHPADDPFAAQGSGAGLVGASSATKGSDLASNITPTAGTQVSASGAFDPFASATAAQGSSNCTPPQRTGGLTNSIVIDAPGAGKTSSRRTRVRSGGRGGLRPPPTSSRTRAGSSQAVDSAVGIDDDLLGGFEAPAAKPAQPTQVSAPAAATADPFAALSSAPTGASHAAQAGSDLDGLFGNTGADGTKQAEAKKSDTSNNPFDDFF